MWCGTRIDGGSLQRGESVDVPSAPVPLVSQAPGHPGRTPALGAKPPGHWRRGVHNFCAFLRNMTLTGASPSPATREMHPRPPEYPLLPVSGLSLSCPYPSGRGAYPAGGSLRPSEQGQANLRLRQTRKWSVQNRPSRAPRGKMRWVCKMGRGPMVSTYRADHRRSVPTSCLARDISDKGPRPKA